VFTTQNIEQLLDNELWVMEHYQDFKQLKEEAENFAKESLSKSDG